MKDITFVELDVHKESTAVAVAEPGWGEPRNMGIIPTTPDALTKLVRRLGGKDGLVVAYEAGLAATASTGSCAPWACSARWSRLP